MKLAPILLSLAAFGCSAAKHNSGFGADSDGGGAISEGAPDGGPGGGGPVVGSNGDASTGPAGTILYAHTAKELFKMDPLHIASPMVSVGTFDCIGVASGPSSMTDIAVSKGGALYAVSTQGAYPLELAGGGKVHCKATWPLPSTHSNFYGLSMAPENTVDVAEVLIAANDVGQLFRIDATTGATTPVGTMGTDPITSKAWGLSGDIVFLANNGSPIAFAAVCPVGSCGGTDTLVELDVGLMTSGSTASTLKVVRGPVNKGAWCTNAKSPATFGSMFGIAAYDDKVYGFSNKGDLVEIHNDDGSACLVTSYPNTSFKGAGVTTSAPVVAPPAK